MTTVNTNIDSADLPIGGTELQTGAARSGLSLNGAHMQLDQTFYYYVALTVKQSSHTNTRETLRSFLHSDNLPGTRCEYVSITMIAISGGAPAARLDAIVRNFS